MKKIQVRNIVSLQQELLTVTKFQVNAATGDMGHPEYVNDGDRYTTGIADTVNENAEIDFGRPMIVKQYRHSGWSGNNGDGEWKMQYWNAWKQEWVDWITGIATLTVTASWTAWVSGEVIETDKIRLVCTVVDSGNTPDESVMGELQVKY